MENEDAAPVFDIEPQEVDLNVPFTPSYWVIPGRFLAGRYPGSEDPATAEKQLKALLDLGLRTFVDLMESCEVNWSGKPFVPYTPQLRSAADAMGIDAVHYRFAIRDLDVPSRSLMVRILDCIDRSIAEDRPVYLHCRGGIGRTGTVVGCYLARHGHGSGQEALAMIEDLSGLSQNGYGSSPETFEQREWVRTWRRGA